MSRLFADTLFKRLFVLMWLALIASHFIGYFAFHVSAPFVSAANDQSQSSAAAGPGAGPALPALRPSSPAQDELPSPLAWLAGDYAIRALVIGLAAWLGAMWLSKPMRRLADAARILGTSPSAVPLIDETRGTQEVRQTARIFNRMQQRLTERFAARSMFLAAVSHDLRTPLTRIRLRLESLPSDPLIERCYADINEMNALLDTILVYLREESDAEPRQRVDIYALAQSLVEDMTEAGHSIAFDGVPAVAYGQPKSLLRCLSNLLENAVHYGKEPEVRVSIEGGRVFADVLDRGPGIPDNRLEQVIKPFFRLEPSRNRNSGGTGLGLHIVRELAERNGGQLEISNRPGGGLRARLSMTRS